LNKVKCFKLGIPKYVMKKILDTLRGHPKRYNFLKKIYGNTIGMWLLKEAYVKYIGFYNGREKLKMMGRRDSDLLIARKIKSGKPFMLARYGSTEFRNLFSEGDLGLLCRYSGFFPNDKKLLKKFRGVYLDGSRQIDILATWNYKNHFINKMKLVRGFPNIENLVPLSVSGPFNCSWLKELEGKKLLIIHPFKASIESQRKKNSELGILPKFKSLKVIRAVQTLAGNKDERFATWFDALNYMKKEIDKMDFDVALIGCGAYGLPLAAYVKSIGKQGLHIGGGLQLFFGIRGKRWKDYGFYTPDWINPLIGDTPDNFKKIEGGCYWK